MNFQIRGKILTITGIVLVFGYFIKESFKSPSDPTQVVMVGNDTLGRDWGAIAEQKERKKLEQDQEGKEDGLPTQTSTSFDLKPVSSEDPLQKAKFNQDNYSSIESPSGQDIITGYDRPEQQGNDNSNDNGANYKTRHQLESEEPQIKYKD